MTKADYDCHKCVNVNCPIRKHIENKNVNTYLKDKVTFRCSTGQQFILEGAPVNGLYFIYNGSVKVFRNNPNFGNQIIRFSKNGEIVGHRGFGTSYVYDISATALTDTILCHFRTAELIELLHKVPELMFEFMLFYADQLQKSESNAKHFGRLSVREKVINGLIFINKKFGQSDDGFINITLSRKDIAEYAGTTQEQVIKVISDLKKENLLITRGKKIGIPDMEKFQLEMGDSHLFLEG